MPSKTIYKTLPASVSQIVQGTYQREIFSTAPQHTAGTEAELSVVSDNIVAATADHDELFSWIRLFWWMQHSSTEGVYEWMLLRQLSADALPDLNTSSVVEGLQKDKRILARGLLNVGVTGYTPGKFLKLELFNIKLRYGEELRFVYRPMKTWATAGVAYGVLEWRKVGE